MPTEIQILIYIILLLLLSAFFSGAETAFTALSIAKTEVIVAEKRWGWVKIQYLTNNLDKCIMSCLIMSNLVNILLSAYLTVIATSMFGIGKGLTIAVGVGTASILLFGEIIPKKIAIQYTEKFVQFSAHILWFTVLLLTPITYPVMRAIRKIWPQKISAGEVIPSVSEDEIRAMVKLGWKAGALDKTSQNFLQKVFTLPKKIVRDIMTPLNKVVAMPNTSTLEELQKSFEESHYSRIPIYSESLNEKDIRLAYLPKIIKLLSRTQDKKRLLKSFKIPKILKVPESIIIQDLLVLFQTKHQHIALVVDENQESVGIVTLEDILEVVFGEITDESDAPFYHKLTRTKKKVELDGDTSLDDLSNKIEQEIPKKFPSHKSIAWLCMELLHRFPKKGDKIAVPLTNIVLLVLSVENKKAKKVSVHIKPVKK